MNKPTRFSISYLTSANTWIEYVIEQQADYRIVRIKDRVIPLPKCNLEALNKMGFRDEIDYTLSDLPPQLKSEEGLVFIFEYNLFDWVVRPIPRVFVA
jgi:hypothetical protein